MERLHGQNGGIVLCAFCAGQWRATQTRRRRAARIVIKAMELYEREGGNWTDLDKLKLCTGATRELGLAMVGHDLGLETIESLGSDLGDITTELLEDTVQLTHPDRHPPERRDLAQRVTSELLRLRPFTFPARKPEPSPPPAPRDDWKVSMDETFQKLSQDLPASRSTYLCEACVGEIPYYYCDKCRAEWEKRQREASERDNAKRRNQYTRRRQRRLWRTAPAICPMCASEVPSRRKGATFCSPACRQKAYRRRNGSIVFSAETLKTRNGRLATDADRDHDARDGEGGGDLEGWGQAVGRT
jgi:hypothetical protein